MDRSISMESDPKIERVNDAEVQCLPTVLYDMPVDMIKAIVSFMTTRFEDVSPVAQTELGHIFARHGQDVCRVVAVDLKHFYNLYGTSKFFKKTLFRDLLSICSERRMFFAACENAFKEKILAGGTWRDQVFMMMLGDHSVVHFSLERGKVRSTMNYLYLRVMITDPSIDWRSTSTTISRKLALPGPDIEQYWWFSYPLTAEQTKVVKDWLPAQLFKELLQAFFDMAVKSRAEGPHERYSYV
jgi:hypothetical protein